MNREDVIRMAREAGFGPAVEWSEVYPPFERFAQAAYAAGAADEREACAKVCEEKQQYAMPIPCPDGIDGCSVMHCVPARREKTGQECAAAIRARGNK